jgi:hypothetical protein
MTLSSKVLVSVAANMTEALDIGNRSWSGPKSYAATLANGIAVGQADKVFADTRTLAASATENLDLAGGVLLDPLGTALTFVKVKALIVAAAAGNTNDVIVGGDVTNTFFGSFADETDAVRIRPGTVFAIACGAADAAGYAVVAGTGDLLKILNGGAGTPVTYDVIIIGTSA